MNTYDYWSGVYSSPDFQAAKALVVEKYGKAFAVTVTAYRARHDCSYYDAIMALAQE